MMNTNRAMANPTSTLEVDTFNPHITVATVIENDGKFLFVQEQCHGKLVLNQPAGHLDPNESLIQAAVRETLEETGWHVDITALLGVSLYRAPANGVTYHRTTFAGKAKRQEANRDLDEGIIKSLWLTHRELIQRQTEHRSPLVLQAVEQYISSDHYPLSMLSTLI